MMFVVLELDTGEQQFFDTPVEAFRIAKEQEKVRRNSVEYIAVGEFNDDADVTVWSGQSLRMLLRTLDDTNRWIRAGLE
jgi:hypothetical protein